MILDTIAEKLKRQSKDDFKGRQFEAWLHATFRTLLVRNGEKELAAKVSRIAYPVSRPAAALADPYLFGKW